MAEPVRQDLKRQEWKTRLEALDRRAAAWGSGSTPLDRALPAGGWTVGQVLEHLCLGHDSYLAPMGKLMDGRGPDPRAATARWKPTVMGGLLARSLAARRRMRAPGIYRPGPTPRAGVLDAFVARQRQLDELLDRATALVWQELRMASPVTRLIRLNLGDAFEVLVTHAERHFGQIDRILSASG